MASTKPTDHDSPNITVKTITKPSADSANTSDIPCDLLSQQEDVPYESGNDPTKPSTDGKSEQKKIPVKSSNKMNIKFYGDLKQPNIVGCCFMPGGELIFCDQENEKIKLYGSSFKEQSSLFVPGPSQSAAVLDDNNVIITLPIKLKLQFIQVFPALRPTRAIILDKQCWGVDVAASKIYVSCYTHGRGDGEVRVYDLGGKLLKNIGVNQDGSNMFLYPDYLAVSKTENKICVSDWGNNTVSCLTSNGDLVYQLADLGHPVGLYVDGKSNVIVCDGGRDTLYAITAAGVKFDLLTSKDGIVQPSCVGFRPKDRTLVVGCVKQADICVYKLA